MERHSLLATMTGLSTVREMIAFPAVTCAAMISILKSCPGMAREQLLDCHAPFRGTAWQRHSSGEEKWEWQRQSKKKGTTEALLLIVTRFPLVFQCGTYVPYS